MSDPERKSETQTDNTASGQPDAVTSSDISVSWKKYAEALGIQWHSAVNLVQADMKLTLYALLICAIIVMAMVGVGLVGWVTLLAAIAYGMLVNGVHWIAITMIVLLINLGAYYVLKKIYITTRKSIGFDTLIQTLLSSPKDEENQGASCD